MLKYGEFSNGIIFAYIFHVPADTQNRAETFTLPISMNVLAILSTLQGSSADFSNSNNITYQVAMAGMVQYNTITKTTFISGYHRRKHFVILGYA